MAEEVQAIAVIDLSIATLTILNVPDSWVAWEIEEELRNKGFHLSNCSWGAFDGHINDERENPDA